MFQSSPIKVSFCAPSFFRFAFLRLRFARGDRSERCSVQNSDLGPLMKDGTVSLDLEDGGAMASPAGKRQMLDLGEEMEIYDIYIYIYIEIFIYTYIFLYFYMSLRC